MLKKIFIALVVIVIVVVGIVALQPSEFRIARTATIAAPAPAVFAQVNDFHKWAAWSPWEKVDPAMKRTFGGAPAGTGATYAWAGNYEIGEGRMTLTESRPSDLIRIKLEFMKPFASHQRRGVHLRACGRPNRRDVEHDRQQQLHGQGDRLAHGHGRDDRR